MTDQSISYFQTGIGNAAHNILVMEHVFLAGSLLQQTLLLPYRV